MTRPPSCTGRSRIPTCRPGKKRWTECCARGGHRKWTIPQRLRGRGKSRGPRLLRGNPPHAELSSDVWTAGALCRQPQPAPAIPVQATVSRYSPLTLTRAVPRRSDLIGIGIVMQSPLGKPVPKLPQVLSYQAIVKAWEFGGLLFKIPLDLSVVVQALTNFSVIP